MLLRHVMRSWTLGNGVAGSVLICRSYLSHVGFTCSTRSQAPLHYWISPFLDTTVHPHLIEALPEKFAPPQQREPHNHPDASYVASLTLAQCTRAGITCMGTSLSE
jgi:hypothetical protein